MKYVLRLTALALAAWVVGFAAVPASLAATPVEAADALIHRLLGDKADQFSLELIPRKGDLDVFEIETVGDKVVLRGSTGGTIASALNWYLKHYCRCQVTWCGGDQLNLPQPLPAVKPKVRIVSPYKYRYYFNYCTFSYSGSWWDWPRWQREIDWMALNGINMPLALTGEEAIWQKVYKDMGLADEDLAGFFPGPAFFAWFYMGNLDGWGGPLPQSWVDSHRDLQKKIVARQRELGITPVLPAFSGHVPAALAQKFPQAKIRKMHGWVTFDPTYMLDPTDPLFTRIGKAFILEQTRQYGTDHLYSADTFNENTPTSDDPAFLAAAGKGVYEAMAAGDPQATWIMQGWLFYFESDFWGKPQVQALLKSVPTGKMILLDLFAEMHPMWQATDHFQGQPWIWCFLHNFGGNSGLYGGLEQLGKDLSAKKSSLFQKGPIGVGLTMEATQTNPIMYDFMTDMMWRDKAPDIAQWVADFAVRRYGQDLPATKKAWQVLLKASYSGDSDTRPQTPVWSRPSYGGNSSRYRRAIYSNVSQIPLLEAWELLDSCSGQLGRVDAYRYDLIDVSRQVLADLANPLLRDALAAYGRQDRQAFNKCAQQYLQLMRDMDELAATRSEFQLGNWIAQARGWGANDQERALYEFNARDLVTLWGDRGSKLVDYSRRQWGGLIKDFYLPRWEKFFAAMDAAMDEGNFDRRAFNAQIAEWEEEWTHQQKEFSAKAVGDSVEVSHRLLEKYRPIITKTLAEPVVRPIVRAKTEPATRPRSRTAERD